MKNTFFTRLAASKEGKGYLVLSIARVSPMYRRANEWLAFVESHGLELLHAAIYSRMIFTKTPSGNDFPPNK
ncbi:hypothetical protein SAMN05444167_4112 [Terriglobus roseus]|uniref:Uncharacterized protein n=1 Tax=Terriglobus roseus TaxID=392734 RepID=A0A1G7R390_9BACT|nr:hypothetical protein SAMN05444167_4112 [Terriglobus roseus]